MCPWGKQRRAKASLALVPLRGLTAVHRCLRVPMMRTAMRAARLEAGSIAQGTAARLIRRAEFAVRCPCRGDRGGERCAHRARQGPGRIHHRSTPGPPSCGRAGPCQPGRRCSPLPRYGGRRPHRQAADPRRPTTPARMGHFRQQRTVGTDHHGGAQPPDRLRDPIKPVDRSLHPRRPRLLGHADMVHLVIGPAGYCHHAGGITGRALVGPPLGAACWS